MRHYGVVEFSVRLTGSGWARAGLAQSEEAELPASYLSDALGEVLLAVAELHEGENAAIASWAQERGEYRWLFSRTDGEVSLQVLALRDSCPRLADAEGSIVFSATCPLDEMARAIAEGAWGVLSLEGITACCKGQLGSSPGGDDARFGDLASIRQPHRAHEPCR
jgi:hypothetical protein